MKKTNTKANTEVLKLIDQMVDDFEKNTNLPGERTVEVFQAFEEAFASFVKKRSLQLAEAVQQSELEKQDKLYFIFLLFHDLFDYSQYRFLLEKLDEKRLSLESEEQQLAEEIASLSEQQKALEQSIYASSRQANEAFKALQMAVVEKGIKEAEAGKKKTEIKKMEAIKEQLKQQ